MKYRLLAAFAVALGLAAPQASAEAWSIDPSHAHVTFSVSHLGFSTTRGVFRDFDAEIDFDPDSMETASVAFTIQTESVDTFWPARDKHVRSKDFLNVKKFPEITFVSKTVRLTGADTADVTGDVTIRGVTNEETFVAKLTQIAPSPFNPDQTIAGFEITGEIDRTKYGMPYGAPAIGAVIPLQIDVEISPAD
ncbi:MAG: YceI family protein [Pseudomonadota bacterium]